LQIQQVFNPHTSELKKTTRTSFPFTFLSSSEYYFFAFTLIIYRFFMFVTDGSKKSEKNIRGYKIKNASGQKYPKASYSAVTGSAKNTSEINLATRLSWQFAFRPVALRPRLSTSLPFTVV